MLQLLLAVLDHWRALPAPEDPPPYPHAQKALQHWRRTNNTIERFEWISAALSHWQISAIVRFLGLWHRWMEKHNLSGHVNLIALQWRNLQLIAHMYTEWRQAAARARMETAIAHRVVLADALDAIRRHADVKWQVVCPVVVPLCSSQCALCVC